MSKRQRLRTEAIIAGKAMPFRQVRIPPPLRFTCYKCRTSMPESVVTEHLINCQPDGANCGKCGEKVKPAEFLAHWHSCAGKPEPQKIVTASGLILPSPSKRLVPASALDPRLKTEVL